MARKKNQLNLGEALVTRSQIERMAADDGMNLGEVVSIAVDRMYREKYGPSLVATETLEELAERVVVRVMRELTN